jgi:hypothetical protein
MSLLGGVHLLESLIIASKSNLDRLAEATAITSAYPRKQFLVSVVDRLRESYVSASRGRVLQLRLQ